MSKGKYGCGGCMDKLAKAIGDTVVKWVVTGDKWRNQHFG
jgi:hypothetical protein